MSFKPLLAEKADLETLRFPVLASPKLDGIRALTGLPQGSIVSRNLKAIPNKRIQVAAEQFPAGLDGEILTYTNGVRDDFNTVQSKVMSVEGTPEFKFHVFDAWDLDATFDARIKGADSIVCDDQIFGSGLLKLVEHRLICTLEELLAYETECLAAGWEGVMMRDPNGHYKHGRSTVKEGILLKLKRFHDDEAVIVGTVERMHNTNEKERDELGHAKRSTAKAGLVPTGTLGALQCEWKGVRFEIGTGFDDATRASLWGQREALLGKLVTFKYQEVGSQGAPRFPVYLGLRGDL